MKRRVIIRGVSADANAAAVQVDVIVTAEIPMPEAYVQRAPGPRVMQLARGLRGGGRSVRAPCLAYVVRHPSAGVMLIDTGMHADAKRDLRRDFGVPMSLMFRQLVPAEEPFDAQLRGLGVDPAAVEKVVMTHLHVDHTSGMRLLENATFVCSAAEWSAAHGRFAAARGYVGHHLPPDRRVECVDISRDGVADGPFPRTLDLLGDGSVLLISTPGHTPGHMSLLLRLEGGRRLLVVGDAAYTLDNLATETLPMLTDDDDASLRSMRQISAFMAADPDALVVPTHDPTAWRALRDAAAAGAAT